jgi:hypothetical protein
LHNRQSYDKIHVGKAGANLTANKVNVLCTIPYSSVISTTLSQYSAEPASTLNRSKETFLQRASRLAGLGKTYFGNYKNHAPLEPVGGLCARLSAGFLFFAPLLIPLW